MNKVNAELKSVSFVDDVFDLEGRFQSLAPINVPMHATIGVNGREGGDLFIFRACNCAWLMSNVDNHPYLITKTLLCDGMSLLDIEGYLNPIISKIDGLKWHDVASKIESMADWEFAK